MVSASWFMVVVPFFVDRSIICKAAPAVSMATVLTYDKSQHNGNTQSSG